MGTTSYPRMDLLFTSLFLGGMILLIVMAPAAFGFVLAVGAAFWWCWWLDAHSDR